MNFKEYRTKTSSTNCYPMILEDSQIGTLLTGLAEELVEFQIACCVDDMKSEIGDVSWYLAEICNFLDYSPYDTGIENPILWHYNCALELTKRALSLNKKYWRGDFDALERLHKIKVLCDDVYTFVCGFTSGRYGDIFQNNIDKLAKRKADDTIKGEGEIRD